MARITARPLRWYQLHDPSYFIICYTNFHNFFQVYEIIVIFFYSFLGLILFQKLLKATITSRKHINDEENIFVMLLILVLALLKRV